MVPTISIIIVTYNGRKRLDKCLTSIFTQTYRSFEVILVDNGSTDDTYPFVTTNFPHVIFITSPKNLGFAGGNNLGIDHAQGSLLLFLNNDTRIDPDFLERYIDAFEREGYDILGVSEKPYDSRQKKKGGGISLTIDRLGHPFIDRTAKRFFYTNGACMLCTKKMYKDTGGLDNNFFMYCEEVDRQWRSRLYGYTIGKDNNLFIYHAGAGSSTSGRLNYTTFLRRNQNTPQMLLKNYSRRNICLVLPCYVGINIGEIIAFLLAGKWRIAYSYLAGRWYVISSLRKSILPQRKIIQAKRVVSDAEIKKLMYQGSAKIHHLSSFLQNK